MRKHFLRRVRRAIADPALQSALERNASHRVEAWQNARHFLPDAEGLRRNARRVREHTIANLDSYLEQFTSQLLNRGWHVHHAETGADACGIAIKIATEHGARTIAKSKSMLSEEVGFNHALEQSGLDVVETDLGEYIVQLRGEAPSHIITPAVHLRREDVAATFAEKLDMPYSTDVETMTATARDKLRQVFLESSIGFTGVNFGVADSGTLCIVTNEGNGRMVSTLPRVHIALMGIERLVPTLDDLALMLQLLPRAATGQAISTYVSLIQSARRMDDPDGPEERHLILLDNGRINLTRSDFSEALLCIRCGACLNACPVFREIGGHAYGSTYPGPIGAVLSPALFGLRSYGHLAKASTLCGACQEACPVQIDLPKLLLRSRREYIRQIPQPITTRLAIKLFSWLMLSPARYRRALGLGRLAMHMLPRRGGWLRSLPPPFSAWTRSRHFPPFAVKPFRRRMKTAPSPAGQAGQRQEAAQPTAQGRKHAQETMDLAARFEHELQAVDGSVVRCTDEEAPGLVAAHMRASGFTQLLTWEADTPLLAATVEALEAEGIECIQPELPHGREADRSKSLAPLADARAGLTGAVAGLADTGTVVLTDGPGRASITSLLPPCHVVLLPARQLYNSMQDWLDGDGRRQIIESSSVVLVTGPSRTADIEMTLTIGVHGPAEVIVFLVE